MQRLRIYISLALIVGILSGCIQSGVFVLFNNTEKTVTVYSGDEWLVLQPKTSQKISGGVSDEITFIVESGIQTQAYDICGIAIPKDFGFVENGHPSLHLQLESNGAIFITPPKSDFPVPKLPDQPHGFPLAPKKARSEKTGWVSQPE